MNQNDLFEITKIRCERNRKLDIAAERLSRYVVNSEYEMYSPTYMMQVAEAKEVINNVFDNELIDHKEILSGYKDEIQKSIADSFYHIPEKPLNDEEVAFLSMDYDNMVGESAKLSNLFKKSQFSVVNLLKGLSTLSTSIINTISDVNKKEEVISSIFKLICCIICTASSFIQDIKIELKEKDCKIIFALLEDENGLSGTKKDDFIKSLEENELFDGIEDIVKHIEYLISLGCLGIKENKDHESLLFIKEKIVRVKRKNDTNEADGHTDA